MHGTFVIAVCLLRDAGKAASEKCPQTMKIVSTKIMILSYLHFLKQILVGTTSSQRGDPPPHSCPSLLFPKSHKFYCCIRPHLKSVFQKTEVFPSPPFHSPPVPKVLFHVKFDDWLCSVSETDKCNGSNTDFKQWKTVTELCLHVINYVFTSYYTINESLKM